MVEASEDNRDADDKLLKDAKIFDPQADNLDEEALEFKVRDPQNQSGTVLYKVAGRDKEGSFEG
jgi:hypothetical protein